MYHYIHLLHSLGFADLQVLHVAKVFTELSKYGNGYNVNLNVYSQSSC